MMMTIMMMRMAGVRLTISGISWKTWQNKGVKWVFFVWEADTVYMLSKHATLGNVLGLTVFCNKSTRNYKYCKSVWLLDQLYTVSHETWNILP